MLTPCCSTSRCIVQLCTAHKVTALLQSLAECRKGQAEHQTAALSTRSVVYGRTRRSKSSPTQYLSARNWSGAVVTIHCGLHSRTPPRDRPAPRSVTCRTSAAIRMSDQTLNSAVSVQWYLRYADWLRGSSLLLAKYLWSCSAAALSTTIDMKVKFDTGR